MNLRAERFLKEVVLVLVSTDQINLCDSQREEELESIVDNLDSTEDGESSEEAHCATYQSKCGLNGRLSIKIARDTTDTDY